jgi:site-specific recombinase XerD
LLERWKPATASNRVRALQQLFKWCVEEGEITDSPMAKMKSPIVPPETPDVLTLADLQAMLKAASGEAFDDLRDTEILRRFMTTGARLVELATLRLEDVVITRDRRHIEVLGKGRKKRLLPLGNKTQRAAVPPPVSRSPGLRRRSSERCS